MIVMITMWWNNNTDTIVQIEVKKNIENTNTEKKDNNWGMAINEEMCNKMPWMQGCKEFLENNKKANIPSSSIVVLNNNQKLWELPMDEWKVEITFEIQNTWKEDVILWEANWSCFCTQWYISNMDGSDKSLQFNNIWEKRPTNINRVIKAWEKQIVTAIYDPEAHGPNAVWPTTRWLTIKTNSSTTPNIKLDFFGTVVKTRTK